MTINPAFDRHINEASEVGKIVLGYGELELLYAMLLGHALKSTETAMRTMFRIIGESARIAAADALMRKHYVDAGLREQYADMYGALRWCTSIRNQYAHCAWADNPGEDGLYFANLSEPAKSHDGFDLVWWHIDMPLLQSQSAYFEYARLGLMFLEYEALSRTQTKPAHPFVMPSKLPQPILHNPPELHIPRWISEDDQLLHTARVQAAKAGVPTPTPAQKAMEAAREKKQTKKQAQKARADAGEKKGTGGAS